MKLEMMKIKLKGFKWIKRISSSHDNTLFTPLEFFTSVLADGF